MRAARWGFVLALLPGCTRTLVASEERQSATQAKTAESEGLHFNPTQHARSVPDRVVALTRVGSSTASDRLKAKARVFSRGGGVSELVIDLTGADQRAYTVRLGGDCTGGVQTFEEKAAAQPSPEGSRITKLGTIEIDELGRGRLVTTLREPEAERAREAIHEEAIAIAPARAERGAPEPIACGMVALPEGDGRG
jgi:hypothetical protein